VSVDYRTCAGEQVNLSNTMEGGAAFLVLNGPKGMAVIDRDKLYIPGVIRMCVNNGSKAVRPNLWTCVDPPDRFLRSVYFDPTITKFIPDGFCGKRLWDTGNDKPLPQKLHDVFLLLQLNQT